VEGRKWIAGTERSSEAILFLTIYRSLYIHKDKAELVALSLCSHKLLGYRTLGQADFQLGGQDGDEGKDQGANKKVAKAWSIGTGI